MSWTRALAIIAVLTVIVLPNTAAAAAPNSAALLSLAKQSLINEYAAIEDRGTALLVPNTDEFGIARSAAERLSTANGRREFNASNGLRFISADVVLELLAVSANGATATLRARESTARYFITSAHEYDPGRDATKQWSVHTFTFNARTGGGWELAYDAVDHPVRIANPAEAVDSVGSHTVIRGGQRAAGHFGLASPSSGGFYNGAAAAYHAQQFAYSADPTYRNWLPNEDCSNFVSQALWSGGWNYRQDGAWDWFYYSSGQSLSWVNAYSLKQFLNFSGRASFLAYFEDLQVGDVLTADWGYNGPGVDHQMIVDARDGGYLSGIFVTYHSTNTYHRPLSDLLQVNPTSSNTYWAWHITGTY